MVKPEDDLQNILDKLRENRMCANPAKYQMMLLGLKLYATPFASMLMDRKSNKMNM